MPLDLPPGGARILWEDLFGRSSSIWTPGKTQKLHEHDVFLFYDPHFTKHGSIQSDWLEGGVYFAITQALTVVLATWKINVLVVIYYSFGSNNSTHFPGTCMAGVLHKTKAMMVLFCKIYDPQYGQAFSKEMFV